MRKAKKIFFIFIAILVLLVFFHTLGWLRPLENLLKRGFLPLQVRIQRISFVLFGKKEAEKVAVLKAKVAELLAENVQLQMLEEENKVLRDELNFLKKEKSSLVLANIVASPSDKIFSSFVLDKGQADGIRKGLAVVSHGQLIGKIIKVDKYSCQVLALLDSQARTAALVLKKEEPFEQRPGLVRGRHSLTMEIELAPSEVEVAVGDLVVSSGLEENIPRGLILGEIVEVEPKTSAFFQKAQVKSLIDFSRLSIVSVILP